MTVFWDNRLLQWCCCTSSMIDAMITIEKNESADVKIRFNEWKFELVS
jgi:hypothetical protein